MLIGIHDSEGMRFPNYALMKISAYHKNHGNDVEWWMPLKSFDAVYSSKVFTFTPQELMLPLDAIKGGTGYGKYENLPKEIDDMFPDYSLYPNADYAIGFLTRGCIRKCPWCVVPKKEGAITPYRSWQEVKRPDSNKIVFMDNNVLASEHGIAQMESMIGQGVQIDFNQGMDARLITSDVANIISRLQWLRFIRLACDSDDMLPVIENTVKLLGNCGVKPYRLFVYMLVTADIASAERRAMALRSMGVDVFAQPYRDFENAIEPTKDQLHFARWVNRREIFKTVERYAEYKK